MFEEKEITKLSWEAFKKEYGAKAAVIVRLCCTHCDYKTEWFHNRSFISGFCAGKGMQFHLYEHYKKDEIPDGYIVNHMCVEIRRIKHDD